jgi:hypothetical protein
MSQALIERVATEQAGQSLQRLLPFGADVALPGYGSRPSGAISPFPFAP